MQTLIIAGAVGKDAVLRRAGDKPVLSFSVAIDNGKDRSGEKRPATWVDASIWGNRAEALNGRITKGTKLALSGRPTVRAHDGKAYLGIDVDQLTFMGGGDRQGGGGGEQRASQPSPRESYDLNDDIPFVFAAGVWDAC